MDSALDLGRLAVTLVVVAMASYAYAMALFGRHAGPTDAMDQDPPFFIILVPCLNESAVIGLTLETLTRLRGRFRILVVDDASNDASVDVIKRSPGRLVSVLERREPDARVGKGAALNAGYAAALSVDLPDAPDRIIVTVFDADSRVPTDFLERVTPYFTDPDVVGVQSAIRMSNARQGWLTLWQDLEFAVWGRIFARAKDRLGSATLGGNGQCVRLSALMALGGSPWRPSLTEDLDLSLRLILRGGRIRFCGESFVAQQAVADVRRLVRQRARWVHGHFVAWEHLPAIVRSDAPRRVRLDLLVFLLLPAALVPLAIATIDGWVTLLFGLGSWSIDAILAWYLLAFASMPLTAWALARERGVDTPRSILHAHLFVGYALIWMTSACRAVWSIIRGDRAWAKTSRTSTSGTEARPGFARDAVPTSVASTPFVGRPGHGSTSLPRRMSVATAGALVLIAVSSLVLFSAAAVTSSTYEQVTRPLVTDGASAEAPPRWIEARRSSR